MCRATVGPSEYPVLEWFWGSKMRSKFRRFRVCFVRGYIHTECTDIPLQRVQLGTREDDVSCGTPFREFWLKLITRWSPGDWISRYSRIFRCCHALHALSDDEPTFRCTPNSGGNPRNHGICSKFAGFRTPKLGHFEAKTAEIGVYLDPKIGHFEAKTGEFGVPK